MKFLAIALAGSAAIAAPAFAQTTAPAAGAPAAAAAPNVTAGASVSDASGAPVGTIESVANGTAVISTGAVKASVPVSSFGTGAKGLVIGMTKTDLEAAVNKQAAKPLDIATGAAISDAKGGKVGTVDAVNGDMVTVATASSKVQLPKKAFAQGPNGLVIGMTAAELDAAAKAAGGGGTGSTPSR